MQGIKFKYSIDKLKVCYRIKPLTYNKLTENPSENPFFIFSSPNFEDVFTEDFILKRIKNSKFDFEIYILNETKEGNSHYGTLNIKSQDDPELSGMCFITLNNKRLYDPFVIDNVVTEWKESKQKIDFSKLGSISNYTKIESQPRIPAKTISVQYNSIFFLEEIISRLGLCLISISYIEIAFDSNINFAKLLKKTVANENYIPVVNRVKYLDVDSRDVINNAVLKYNTTRKRAVNLAYYIEQSKGRLDLKCYNKSREIEIKSGKKYIYKWLDMYRNIHRMEIKAKREPINSFCKVKKISLSEFLYNLHTGENLSEAFNVWLNKIIHFKRVENPKGRDVTVFDLVRVKRN